MATNPPIQIGELTDVPAPGSGVKAAWHQEVTNRILHRFATVAARTAAFTAPLPAAGAGQASYLATGDATQGPEYFNGVNWRKPWNQAWGYIGSATAVANSGVLANNADVPNLAVTFTGIAGRRYRVTASMYGGVQAGAGASELYIVDGAGSKLAGCVTARSAIDTPTGFHVTLIQAIGSAGPLTYKLRNFTTATSFQFYGSAAGPNLIVVEDVGPSGAPS